MSTAAVSRFLRPTFSVLRTHIRSERLATCAAASSTATLTRLPLTTPAPLLQHSVSVLHPPILSQVRGLRSGSAGWVGGRAGVRTAAAAHEVVEDPDQAKKQLSKEVIECVNQQVQSGECGRLFAVVFLQGKQHRVTTGDLLIVQSVFPPNIGDALRIEKVMMVGGRDFTVYGRPLLRPGLVEVEAKVVEKTLSHCRIYFYNRRRKNSRRTKFNRETHTLLRITKVEVMRPVDEVPEVEGVDGRLF